jgi:hypothetical protein
MDRYICAYAFPPPPLAPYTLPPSLPHSLKRREPVKDARRQHADRVVVQVEAPGHETTTQSALTHSTSTCPHPLGIHTSPGPIHPPTLASSLTEAMGAPHCTCTCPLCASACTACTRVCRCTCPMHMHVRTVPHSLSAFSRTTRVRSA